MIRRPIPSMTACRSVTMLMKGLSPMKGFSPMHGFVDQGGR